MRAWGDVLRPPLSTGNITVLVNIKVMEVNVLETHKQSRIKMCIQFIYISDSRAYPSSVIYFAAYTTNFAVKTLVTV